MVQVVLPSRVKEIKGVKNTPRDTVSTAMVTPTLVLLATKNTKVGAALSIRAGSPISLDMILCKVALQKLDPK